MIFEPKGDEKDVKEKLLALLDEQIKVKVKIKTDMEDKIEESRKTMISNRREAAIKAAELEVYDETISKTKKLIDKLKADRNELEDFVKTLGKDIRPLQTQRKEILTQIRLETKSKQEASEGRVNALSALSEALQELHLNKDEALEWDKKVHASRKELEQKEIQSATLTAKIEKDKTILEIREKEVTRREEEADKRSADLSKGLTKLNNRIVKFDKKLAEYKETNK